jgi:DNA polymerase-1
MIIDIETDGIDATKVHCIVCRDASTGQVRAFGPDELVEGIRLMRCATRLIGHNLCGFDLPVLERLHNAVFPSVEVADTLILSRLVWPDVAQDDWQRTSQGFPPELVGRHSLRAWGYRLGLRKDSWGETTDWAAYSKEMLEYCIRDTEVTLELWRAIAGEKPTAVSVDIEHRFAACARRMERSGFAFDADKARRLVETLMVRRQELHHQLVSVFPPKLVQMKTKVKEVPFNPSSRQDIARVFTSVHGWKPSEFTGDGKPRLDEAVLGALPYPEAKLLLEYLTVEKRIGQIAEGKEAWLRLVSPHGRIHGGINTNGAVTGRCTHSRPNMAQVPGVRSAYGKECRELFTASPGWVLVGADASGLELRCLAHYMSQWDGGAYAKEVVSGDVHTANQKAAGLATRDQAKLFIYALIYGAGPGKLGSIVGGGPAEGQRLKRRFLEKVPALKTLQERVQHISKSRGFLVGIDGRHLPIRSPHAALNTLLQSAGAVAVKLATIILHEELEHAGIGWGEQWRMVAHVHDELQIECDPGVAAAVGEAAVAAIRTAGERLKFRCPLDGAWRSGASWADTH